MGSLLLVALLTSPAQIDVVPPDPPTAAAETDQPSSAPDAMTPAEPAAEPAPTDPVAGPSPSEPPVEPAPAELPESLPAAAAPRTLTALPELPDVQPACPEPAPVPTLPPCESVETAQALTIGGLVVAGAGLLGAAGFTVATLIERGQAQELLDSSPAFGQLGERYVVRDPQHPDVAAYEEHRSSASVLAQLGWIGAGLALSGAATAATAALLGSQAEACGGPAKP